MNGSDSEIEKYLSDACRGQSGEVRVDCPNCCCDGSQNKTMSVNTTSGLYHCHRCNLKGKLKNNEEKKSLVEFLWNKALPINDHQYLKKKQIKNHGCRIDQYNNLVVPLSIHNRLSSLQFVKPDGSKKLLSKSKGGVKKGSSFVIPGDKKTVYFGEGLATVSTAHERTGSEAVMLVDSGNFVPAIKNLDPKTKYPDSECVFLADNDPHGKGLAAAKEAAPLLDAKIVMPDEIGFDFNDLFISKGAEAVKKQLKKFIDFNNTDNLLKETKKTQTLSFPEHVMTGAAAFFTDVYSDYLETPKQFLFVSYLTCLGNLVSKRLTIASEIKIQPRLFTVLIGQSARARKSTSMDKTIEHFSSVVEDFGICHGLGSAEGLQRLLRNKENQQSGLLLTWDELRAFVDKAKIMNSVLLACINTLFETNRYQNSTKKTSINLKNAHISILGASTLETYSRMFDSNFLDIGFLNRVFVVVGDSKPRFSFPSKIPKHETDIMAVNLRKIISHVGDGLELDMTHDARKKYDFWYMNFPDSIHARRLDGYAIRFMMLLAVNNLKHEIDLETVNDAIALCDWQLEIRKRYDPIDAENVSARMEEAIRRALRHGPLKDWELKRKTGANRSGLWVYRSALQNLQQREDQEIVFQDKKWHLVIKDEN